MSLDKSFVRNDVTVEVSQLTSSDHTVVSSYRSGNESRPRSPPKIPGAEPFHKKNNNEAPSYNYKGVSNSERDRKYLAHAGAGTAGDAVMALAQSNTAHGHVLLLTCSLLFFCQYETTAPDIRPLSLPNSPAPSTPPQTAGPEPDPLQSGAKG